MKKEVLQKALSLSSASTVNGFFEEVLSTYIDQKEEEIIKQNGLSNHLVMTWGRAREFAAVGYSEDGRKILIEEGSDFAVNETPSLTAGYKEMRDKLKNEGIVKKTTDGGYVFVEDYSFGSLSTAASVVRGVVLNGNKSFKKEIDK
ncbi:DUF4357 domain-containing protein [Oceanobacillus oncorhynchi]|uniref:DUF4357 domain-containing protein n=1 Tax=Oceanobacillus oncorhynchi TaxID=545501 RepID=UPI0025A3B1CC|nr:DUF4357 domain-containing protein [Oceanobacillus oncorhynchi]MDM8101254.1 DUF4357 domain-containing protein [Oceanobacillus oncorhynchi]